MKPAKTSNSGQPDVGNPPVPQVGTVPAGGVLTPVLVLVLWLVCLTVGVLGFAMPYERPKVVCYCEEPVEIERIEVELAEPEQLVAEPVPPDLNLPTPPPDAMALPTLPLPELPQIANAPAAPALVTVAPTPNVAFALPVVGPVKVASTAGLASYRLAGPASPSPQPAPKPQTLTYGYGDGRQPAPDYPREALRQGQEGVVTVRMVVNEDGRVASAEAAQPSPWVLLNDSAVRTVLRKWRFESGPVRLYEVAIRFQIRK